MTNLSKDTRLLLDTHFTINHIAVDQQQRSKDGTFKNAIKLHDNRIVESRKCPSVWAMLGSIADNGCPWPEIKRLAIRARDGKITC